MNELSIEDVFRPYDNLEKSKKNKYVIDWIIKHFKLNIDYQHSFKDQWIGVNIWTGQLSISFDSRVKEQIDLLNAIPASYKGCLQQGTGKIVNESVVYIDLNKAFEMPYPKIIKTKVIQEIKHHDNDGDIFYTYVYELSLSDNTIIHYSGHGKIDMKYTYPSLIQQRYFYNIINTQKQ